MAGNSRLREPRRDDSRGRHDGGFMMVAILIGMGVAAIMMTAALPSWRQQVQRTREEDLIFRGEQYARAIVLYQIKNRCARPPSIDVLVSQHYLRKKWKDPVTNDDFDLVGVGIVNMPGQGPLTPVGSTPVGQSSTPQAGGGSSRGGSTPVGQAGQSGATRGGGAPIAASGQQPGITGVRSKSSGTSIKVYQQQQQYNSWQFDATLMAQKMNINLTAVCNPQQQGGRQGGPGQPGAGRGGQQGGGVGPGGQPARGGTGPGRGGTPPAPPATGVGRGRGGN